MSNKLPFITIITPTYNRADLLEYAILSVINQRQDIPFDWEYIIVDDGSTDSTKSLVQKYIKKYPHNIHYYRQKNSGIPGVGRNNALEHMNKKSDYVIFLDSDDELMPDCILYALKKFAQKEQQGEGKSFLGLYFLCKDEHDRIIGNKAILQGQYERKFTYQSFLKSDINVEMGLITKSCIFLDTPRLRFADDVISEGVMWSKMRQYMDKHHLYISVFDYVGRFYRRVHTSEIQITKTRSRERFKKNALGNEYVLAIIGKDLIKYGYKKIYGDYLFRTGLNRLLFGERKKGLNYLKESLGYNHSCVWTLVYLVALINHKFFYWLYKIYVWYKK